MTTQDMLSQVSYTGLLEAVPDLGAVRMIAAGALLCLAGGLTGYNLPSLLAAWRRNDDEG